MHLSIPTTPLPGLLGELVGMWPFEKSNPPPIGERPVVKSPCMHYGWNALLEIA